MPIDPLFFRSRGFLDMEERFGATDCIASVLEGRAKTQQEIRALEIGFGEGKCLLEMRSRFLEKKFEFYGVNSKPEGNMHAQSDLSVNAARFGIDLNGADLPAIDFYDCGCGLCFPDGHLDIIVSQMCIYYVLDKAKLIEECWRTLKDGGEAFLHIDTNPGKDLPDYMRLNIETPRFIVYDGTEVVRIEEIFGNKKEQGYDIIYLKSPNNPRHALLRMTKNRSDALHLDLCLDKLSSIDLNILRNSDPSKSGQHIWFGTRSVYQLNGR